MQIVHLNIWGVFLDLSKAFRRVLHDGLLFRLKRLSLSGKYYSLMNSFPGNRQLRVILNVHLLKWSPIKLGISQGSNLSSLIFSLYINVSLIANFLSLIDYSPIANFLSMIFENLELNKLNWLNAKVIIIKKPVNWFVEQINLLVSIWWQLWHLVS